MKRGLVGRQGRLLLRCVLTVVAALAAPAAMAQGSAVLTGVVTDGASRQALADVVVTATSPSLQGEQMVVTDAAGLYRLPQLPSGTFTVRFEKQGYLPFSRADVQLRVDRTVRLNIELMPETLSGQEIVVVGKPPTIDVGSTSTGINVGADFVKNIALVRPGGKDSASRSFESLAEVAPGANSDAYGVSVNGTTSPENQFIVDGLSVNDPAYGLLGTPLSIDFVQEVNVVTGGYMPEFGRSTGGVMNVVTKSGSNEFQGSVFANYSPGLLVGSTPTVHREGQSIQTREALWNQGDFGAEMGGPILKDKLWFYAGFAPSFSRNQLVRSLHRIVPDESGAPTRDAKGLSVTEEIDDTRKAYFADQRSFQYIGKLTYLLNQDHNLTVSIYGAPKSSGGRGHFGFSPRTGASEVANINGPFDALAHVYNAASNDLSLKWASAFLNKHLLLDATLGWHHQTSSTLPSDGSGMGDIERGEGLAGNPGVIYRRWQPSSGYGYHSIVDFEQLPDPSVCGPSGALCPVADYLLGGPGFMDEAELDRYQGKAVLTYLFTAFGHHIVKAGIDVEWMRYLHNKGYSGGVLLRERLNGQAFDEYRQYGVMTGPDEAQLTYVQSAESTSSTVGGFVQDSWTVADLFTINAGLRFDQQIVRDKYGAVALALNNQLSPRVGVIYDFTQQGRSKIFANFARFYEGVPLDVGDRSFGDERMFRRRRSVADCDPAADFEKAKVDCRDPSKVMTIGNPESPSQTHLLTGGGDTTPVDPALEPQSSDEWVIGGEYEVVSDGRLGLQYTKRYMNSVIEDMSRDEGMTYFLGNPSRGFASDFPAAVRDYDAVTVYFSKAFADLWMAQASYTYSILRGNYSGLFRPENGQLDPNINSDFDLISLLDNKMGPLPGDRTHSFKLFGSKEFILTASTSLNLGLSYRTRSGTPINYFAGHPVYSNTEVMVLPRGSGGRLPWVHEIDSHLGYNWRLSKSSQLSVMVDIFNLFNFGQSVEVDQLYTPAYLLPYVPRDKSKTPQQETCIASNSPPGCQTPIQRNDGTPFDLAEANPNYGNATRYQPPRSVRLGAKLTF